jgi:hypothetical protein
MRGMCIKNMRGMCMKNMRGMCIKNMRGMCIKNSCLLYYVIFIRPNAIFNCTNCTIKNVRGE